MKYFKNITNLKELKQQYKKLAMKYHPDRPTGSTEIMQIINNEYEYLLKKLSSNTQEEKEIQEFKDIIDQLINIPNINIDIVGNWIWVYGDTKPIKEKLKQLHFYWASKKKKWYFRQEEYKCSSRGKKSYEEIKEKYGCTTYKTKQYKQIN